jgi:hypothetical protein
MRENRDCEDIVGLITADKKNSDEEAKTSAKTSAKTRPSSGTAAEDQDHMVHGAVSGAGIEEMLMMIDAQNNDGIGYLRHMEKREDAPGRYGSQEEADHCYSAYSPMIEDDADRHRGGETISYEEVEAIIEDSIVQSLMGSAACKADYRTKEAFEIYRLFHSTEIMMRYSMGLG